MLLFFFSFLFFCRGRDIFAKIKHTKLTYYSTFISRIQHKISIFFLLFFRETDVVNRSSFIFSSLGFSFGLSFLTFFKWWQWLEGHSFGLVLGIFVLNYSDLFGFIRSSRQAWLGESQQKLFRKSRQIGLSLCPKRGQFGPCLRYKPEMYKNILFATKQ